MPMDRLTDGIELLDGPLDDPDVLAGNLRDLRWINRRLGGVELSASAIDALAAHRAELTLLDVGTGGADIPLALLKAAERRGRRLAVMGIDNRPEVVTVARLAAHAASVGLERLEIQIADGRAMPFPDRSYDVAHASLLLHHLAPDDAVALLTEMGRVARLGVVVNDLDRGWLAWLGAWLFGHLLTGNRYTRHDAPLSVRRAYRADEAADLLRAAGLVPVLTVHTAVGQRYAIAAVHGWDAGSDPDLEDGRGVGE